ncbi:hypothetical protein, partial [Shewanella indica]|uniref:hypothetical protein n=1 Tax=Shewanella indica TaxID=768528 RepID=UPI001C04D02F
FFRFYLISSDWRLFRSPNLVIVDTIQPLILGFFLTAAIITPGVVGHDREYCLDTVPGLLSAVLGYLQGRSQFRIRAVAMLAAKCSAKAACYRRFSR